MYLLATVTQVGRHNVTHPSSLRSGFLLRVLKRHDVFDVWARCRKLGFPEIDNFWDQGELVLLFKLV